MTHRIILTTAALAGFALPAAGAIINRYSFSNPAGPAPDGSILTDSASGAHGLVRGANASFSGTGLSLPGGSSSTAAYADLPNGLVSSLTGVTFEGWVTVNGGGNSWARVFDFGSTNPGGGSGEVTGPGNTNGGGTDGLDYFMLSASRGTDYNVQRLELRNEDPAGGGISTFDSGVPTVFGQAFHFAVSWEDTGPGTSVVNYWRDGVQLTTNGVVAMNLADLTDVNNWLGRSTWLDDSNMNGTFDEFRIHNVAVDQAYIDGSILAGPDQVTVPIIPEPSVLAPLGLACLMLTVRRRRP